MRFWVRGSNVYKWTAILTWVVGMTDPKAQEEMAPPPKPPRPSQQPTSTTQRQMDADEMYARQLSEHYNATGRRAPPPGWESDPRYQRPRGSEESDDREYNFFDGMDCGICDMRTC
jgi:hypothetical protein